MKNLLLILSASCLILVLVNDQRDRASLAATRDAINRLTPVAEPEALTTAALSVAVDLNGAQFGTRSLAQLYAAKPIFTITDPATSHHAHHATRNRRRP